MQQSWGAIFDWDGVIIDSSWHHEESWNRLAAEIGKPLPEGHFKKSFGMKNEIIIPTILDWSHEDLEIRRLSLRKEELYREIIMETGIAPLPGVAEWLNRLHAASIPCVIGSSTHRKNIETSLGAMGFAHHFDSMITAENVSHGKPDPEVFLKAAEAIGRKPEKCVVFEDAHVGIEAAQRAGMRVVAVASTHPAESLGKADLVVKRLDECSIEAIGSWLGG